MRDKLRELHKQVDGGLRPWRRYTVGDALEDWLAQGTDGLSARTVTLYRGTDPRNRTNRVLRDATTAVRAGPGTHHGAS